MYDYIGGPVIELTPTYVVVEAGGIGYYINISVQTYAEIEHADSARIYIHFMVREDAQILYGFATKEERELFRLLISVSGVGGGTARMILSTYSSAELSNIIASENSLLLKNVKGLGLKTAQKIIVELKDKMLGIGSRYGSATDVSFTQSSGETYSEAVSALLMLGFNKGVSEKAVGTILKDNPTASVEEIIRLSLKKL